METTIVHWGYIGTMENEMETSIVYWGHIGTTKTEMETTITYTVFSKGLLGGIKANHSLSPHKKTSRDWDPCCVIPADLFNFQAE